MRLVLVSFVSCLLIYTWNIRLKKTERCEKFMRRMHTPTISFLTILLLNRDVNEIVFAESKFLLSNYIFHYTPLQFLLLFSRSMDLKGVVQITNPSWKLALFRIYKDNIFK